MSHAASRQAQTDAPVLDVVAQRWSTRIFDVDAPVDEAALRSGLEAARWAPSANNTQPCHFVVSRRGSDAFATICAALTGFNPSWAPAAGALLVVIAETVTADGQPLKWSAYDSGQAAAYFTLQAHAAGMLTHQMGGFDGRALSVAFGLADRFIPLAVIAVGTLGDVANAKAELREREAAARTRRPVRESILLDD